MCCLPNRSFVVTAVLGLLICASGAAASLKDDGGASSSILDFVDPLIGTINGGHVFPGATLPFAMAKAVADVSNPSEKEGGFASDDSDITGFSHMHDDGTGGAASLGNFPIWAQAGCSDDDINKCVFMKKHRQTKRLADSVKASPGYFSITLNTLVKAEMTTTNHTALYRFTFPTDETITAASNGILAPLSPVILVELDDLPATISSGFIQANATTGRIQGSGTFKPSFGDGSYNLSFCADFNGQLRRTGTFLNSSISITDQTIDFSHAISEEFPPSGAWAQFDAPENDQIMARVGVSFISMAQACLSAEKEIPDWNFDKVIDDAKAAWEKKLTVIDVDATGVSDEIQKVFWSGTYRAMISPQDYTGENYLWNSSEPYYDSYYCIWDSFRSVHPLLTILDPESQTLMIRSLIDIFRHEGKLPDCRMSLCKGFTQGGSNADVVLADAYLKNIAKGVDWATGYAAVISDAEVPPINWSIEGRGGLASWKSLGYIPIDDGDYHGGPHTRSISRTVEYAYNDFCIALMAKGLSHAADASKYVVRSENWKNLFKEDQESYIGNTALHPIPLTNTNFTGFLQPRNANGSWAFQDPAFCSPLSNFTGCYLNEQGGATYEGSSWMYTFYVPHDMASLITTLGGRSAFVARLEYLHTSGLLYMGDEQAFLPVFQFHYAGRPALSAKYAHFYIPSQFNASINGIAGNDDSGAMGSFTTLSMMGLWPVSGQNVYLITPPFFAEIKVTNPSTGRVATVRNIGFDADYRNIYIQKVFLNGNSYTRNWIDHDFWLEGGTLELELGPEESEWGTRDEDLPPSVSTGMW